MRVEVEEGLTALVADKVVRTCGSAAGDSDAVGEFQRGS